MMRRAMLLLILFGTWLLLSGYLEPQLLALGAASALLVCFLALRMGFFATEAYLFHLLPRLPRYWAWLLKEIVKSNLEVARIVLDPRLPISPTVVKLDASRLGPVGQALLANSITLTPGTATVDVNDGQLTVHCLTREAGEALLEGEMSRRVAAVTGD